MIYHKNFQGWSKLKKILHSLPIYLQFNEGEVWWAALGANIGIEIDGKGENFDRPIVIVRKFSKDHMWVVPLTRRTIINNKVHLSLSFKIFGVPTAAMITQLQTMSQERLLRRIGILTKDQFLMICKSLITLLLK